MFILFGILFVMLVLSIVIAYNEGENIGLGIIALILCTIVMCFAPLPGVTKDGMIYIKPLPSQSEKYYKLEKDEYTGILTYYDGNKEANIEVNKRDVTTYYEENIKEPYIKIIYNVEILDSFRDDINRVEIHLMKQ